MDKVTYAICKKLVEDAGMIDVAELDAKVDELYSLLSGKMYLIGETTTPLEDQSTTNPILINGVSTEAEAGNLVIYDGSQFVFDGTKWILLGNVSAFGTLAYKDSASASYTPKGRNSQPILVTEDRNFSFDVTPAGTNSSPTFIGSQSDVHVLGTPSGSVSKPTFTGTKATIKPKVTAAGVVSKPNITVTPETTLVNSITNVGTLPTFAMQVVGETMSFVFGPGTLPTKGTDTTVMVGASAALDSAPVFTGQQVEGTATYTPSGEISRPAFNGITMDSSGNFTPQGSVTAPVFSGTQKSIGFGFKLPTSVSPPIFTGTEETIVSS